MSNSLTIFCLVISMLLYLSSGELQSQSKATMDSLRAVLPNTEGAEKVDLLNTMAKGLIYQDAVEATKFINQAIALSDELDYPEGKIIAWVVQGALANIKVELTEAEEILDKASLLAQEIEFYKGLAYANLSLGVVHIKRGNYDQAIETHFDGARAAQQSNLPDLEVAHLLNIGAIKQINLELDEAIKYLEEAMLIAEEENAETRLGEIYGNLGIINYKKNDFGQSIVYHQKGLAFFRKLDLKAQSAISLLNIGLAYANLREEEKAMEYYDSSQRLRAELGDRLGVSRTLRYKGGLMNDLGRPKQALEYLEEALSVASKFEDQGLLSDIYLQLHFAYEKLRYLEKAMESYKAHVFIKDSLAANMNKAEVAKLTAQFELDRLEKENVMREQESQIKDLEIAKRNQLIIGLLVMSILIVVWLIGRSRGLKNQLVISQKDHVLTRKELALQNNEFNIEKGKLVAYADELLSKNEVLESKRAALQSQSGLEGDFDQEVDQLIEKMRDAINNGKDWTAFNLYFDVLYPDFFDRLKAKTDDLNLTLGEHRLVSIMKINLTNKEIGGILNISRNSVVRAKYRLRHRLDFSETKEMEDFILEL